jgi:HK97 family phage major capsid protein
MPTDSIIDRTDAGALIPEDAAQEILGTMPEQSAVMRVARQLPQMSRKQRRLPVWASLPTAYFVNGDTGLKQTTEMSWRNVYVNAEELAVIVPIPDTVADDIDYDIWDQARPYIAEAVGLAFDQAVLYGINAPDLWPECVVEQCDATGHTIALGDNGDLYDDLLGEGGVLSLVEEDGFMPNGHIASLSMKSKFRGLRDTEGQPIFKATGEQGTAFPYTLDGEGLIFPRNGSIDPSRSLLISGDWSQLVYAIRQDITWKILDQAVIQDSDGAIVYNLAQQDMTALRLVFRVGWALPNPINRVNEDIDTRLPFAYLEPQNAS